MHSFKISVAARSSPLSKAQVSEVERALKERHVNIILGVTWIDTTGDLDQKTSLRTQEKTDFFTKEIDQLLLDKKCQAAIHSAKDLPDPLPENLSIAALTKGVDPSDSLVLKKGETLHSLPKGAVIGTSSIRREEAVRSLRDDLTFSDIRGTIEKRLLQLENGTVHGVVIAEAALIRLGLTDLNRITLPGETTPLQGQLAIVVRKRDEEMHELFSCLDSR